jgi:hypothetical protein
VDYNQALREFLDIDGCYTKATVFDEAHKPKCCKCRFFDPDDPPRCIHKKSRIAMYNFRFPFQNGCKNMIEGSPLWMARQTRFKKKSW